MATATNAKGLFSALLEVQKNAPALVKDATNPHFKNKFVSLDNLLAQVRSLLSEHGIVLSQRPTVVANGDGLVPALKTSLVHAASGEELSDTMLLLLSKDDPQGQGSALSYARRYALMSMLALAGEEDDDGQKASQPQRRAQTNGQDDGQFTPPTGKPITQARRKKLDALIDQLVTANQMKPEHVEAWSEKRGVTYATITTGLADELEASLLKLAKTAGVA
jgi:hypothetical protein